MEANQISILIDTKLDVHDKLKFKQWTECQVNIEAVKCLPCFLRISFTPTSHDENKHELTEKANPKCVIVSINVPGVTISLAASRTRQHSFGIFWTQSRKNCYIYFAPETEITCRRLMKWMKKSMKNLELYRQIVLEQRRNSRGPTQGQVRKYAHEIKTLEVLTMDSICSYTSGIYEEIPDNESLRAKEDKSRLSIASGIYEEMKPPTNNRSTKQIILDIAPPLPPLPPHRKRINTFEMNMKLGQLPRCNTNPESEAIKKKKYKNMFDNLFGVTRSKRAESVSETQASSIDDVINCTSPKRTQVAEESIRKREKQLTIQAKDKRNSFSSPDLSKINLLQFDENDEKTEDFPNISFSICQDLTLGCKKATESIVSKEVLKMRRESIASLNVSAQIPFNFNFSACNTSKINLVGANVANMGNETIKIPIDDLTGYCLMAPIIPQIEKVAAANNDKPEAYTTDSSTKTEDSAVYVNMNNSLRSEAAANAAYSCISPSLQTGSHFSNHLYENLLTFKATQELETLPVLNIKELSSTSTPTEVVTTLQTVEEENFYQTPRKSIISLDEKIPSYYPNISDNVKGRRSSRSPLKERIMSAIANEILSTKDDEVKPEIPLKRKHKLKRQENVQSSPLRKTEQKYPIKTTTIKQKAQTIAVQKISENVYAVGRKGSNKKETQKVLQDKVNVDLLQLSVLPQIDFKFDDIKLLVNNNTKAHWRAAQCAYELEKFELCAELCEALLKENVNHNEAKELFNKNKAKKLEVERNKRKELGEERRRLQQLNTVCTALLERGVKFDDMKKNGTLTGELLKPKFLPLEDHSVHLDKETQMLVWPAAFSYPEFLLSEFQQQLPENVTIAEVLDSMLAEPMPCDKHNIYKPDTVNIYYENRKVGSVHKVDDRKTIKEVLQEKGFFVTGGSLLFYIVPKNSQVEQQFIHEQRRPMVFS